MAVSASLKAHLISLLPDRERFLADDNATLRRMVSAGRTHKPCPHCGRYLPTLDLLALRADWLESGMNYVADIIVQARDPRGGHDADTVEHAYGQLGHEWTMAQHLAKDLKALRKHERSCRPESALSRFFRETKAKQSRGRSRKATVPSGGSKRRRHGRS